MSDSASDVKALYDHRPNGEIWISFSWVGIDPLPIGAAGQLALRSVASQPDAVVRERIRGVLGDAAAVAWDDGPHQDELHRHRVPGYVPVQARIRAMFAGLP